MNKIQKIANVCLFSAVFLSIVFVGGCQTELNNETSEDPLVLPPQPPLPVLEIPPVQKWDGMAIKSLRLTVNEVYPHIKEGTPRGGDIESLARRIIERLRIDLVDDGAESDAVLTIKLKGQAFKDKYVDQYFGNLKGECYAGGKVDGQIILSASDYPPLTFPIKVENTISKTISDSYFESHRNPEDYNLRELWYETVIDAMYDIWGAQALVCALDETDDGTGYWPNHPIYRRLMKIGPTEEIVNSLIHALMGEDYSLSHYAVNMIGEFYPKVGKIYPEVEDTIPYLSQSLLVKVGSMGVTRSGLEGLGITGDYKIRWDIALLLGRFGPRAEYSVPFLTKGYNLGTYESNYCSEALEKITGVSSNWETWLRNRRRSGKQ
ncbi:MAG: hypothetical protein MIO92_15295 [Methanosarcinaceae archaeon]|nr:hypothetical protein [Methanosarcinaceae archaeon]